MVTFQSKITKRIMAPCLWWIFGFLVNQYHEYLYLSKLSVFSKKIKAARVHRVRLLVVYPFFFVWFWHGNKVCRMLTFFDIPGANEIKKHPLQYLTVHHCYAPHFDIGTPLHNIRERVIVRLHDGDCRSHAVK